MRALEDKLKPGAMIASLSHPWGQEVKQEENVMHGGYHLIWREIYFMSQLHCLPLVISIQLIEH